MIDNVYYAVTRSDELTTQPLARELGADRLVVFRDETGAPRALRDRCAHRGMRLSLGRVTRGCVECPYHGWRYDGAGRCVAIPDLDYPGQIPARAAVTAFDTLEHAGYVWVRRNVQSHKPRWPIPSLPEATLRGWRAVSHAREVACDWRLMVENVLDGSHLPFVHAGSLNKAGLAFHWVRGFRSGKSNERPPELQVDELDNGFVAHAESPKTERGARAFRFRFLLPSTTAIETDYGDKCIRVWVHVVPTGSGRCRVEHTLYRNFMTSPFADPLFLRNARRILAEDAVAVEAQQEAYGREGADWEVSVRRDRLPLQFRKLLRRELAKTDATLTT